MDLRELLGREPPQPWSQGGKIPWNEPAFSARMLKEHLSQDHGLASRRSHEIDVQIEWLNDEVLPGNATILDLGCGPGLYTSRLAKLGHRCVGIDFSPASIQHARSCAAEESLDCTYRLEDLREADLGSGFDAVLLLYAEFNTFPRPQAERLLGRARAALATRGTLVLEVHTEQQIRALGAAPPSWYVTGRGLFAEEPHLCLIDCVWREEDGVSVERFTVFRDSPDAPDTPDTYVCTTQAHADAEYDSMLTSAGFTAVRRRQSPADRNSGNTAGLIMITAEASES